MSSVGLHSLTELITLGFELGYFFAKPVDRGTGTPEGSSEIRARRLRGPGIGASLTLGGIGSALGIEFVEGELAVLASADDTEVCLLAVLVGRSGSSASVEPRESVCGHCAVCGHRTPEATSTAESRSSLRGNL
jgi:hypothetical protein